MAKIVKELDYSALSLELESIIAKLQDSKTSIDQSLDLYERGMTITKQLSEYLAVAENRLNKINIGLEES